MVTGTGKYLRGIRFWHPADGGIAGSTVVGALFAAATGSEITDTRIEFGDLSDDPVGGWVTRYLPAPVALTAGDQYVVVCHFPDGTPVTAFAWTADKVDGPLRAQAGINARFQSSTATLVIPSSLSNEQNYWVDPMVGDATCRHRARHRRILRLFRLTGTHLAVTLLRR